jgi:PAS domain S-box-containing protein
MTHSIRNQFTTTILLASAIFSFAGGILVWRIFHVQKQQAIELQSEVGKRAINEFIILAHELEDRLVTFPKLYNLLSLSHDQQVNVMTKIRNHRDTRHHDIINEVVLFANTGQILGSASRISISPDPQKYSWATLQKQFTGSAQNEMYVSPVDIDKNGEPFIIVAVPLINFQTGEVGGILASQIRINLIWDEIVRKPIGQHGIIYITDQNGQIVSHSDPSVVFRQVAVDISKSHYFHNNLSDKKIIRVVENVTIGNQIFAIVVDRPVSEALALTIQTIFVMAGFFLLIIVAGVASGFFFTKKIIQPIESLAHTALKIKTGDLNNVSTIASDNEFGLLSESFNGMTAQLTHKINQLEETEEALKESQADLEQKVIKRTNELQILLKFSQMLASTTDLKSLYRQCVESVKNQLNLDFSTLMLLTEDHKSLVIRDTIGLPESTIGTFSLVEGQGLSTYVIKEKTPATVLNFNTESRFEVPPIVISKKITSALCVPMMIGKDIFGILIGHTLDERIFHEDEISLYQSFANQTAVAIDNAVHLQNLHDSELKFKELFDNANDAILVYDMSGVLLEVNKVACERLDYTRNELLNLPPGKIVAPQFIDTLQERITAVRENKKEIFETAHICSNGKEIPIELSCTLIEYEGRPAILGIARDISERKKMEEELLKNRKLESIGVLAGGIAHDFNNILAAIIGNINLATLQIKPDNKAQELLFSAEKAALRARDLTQQLLTFSKGGEPVKEIASIAEVIEDSTEFILHGQNIMCNYTLSDLWPVEIDAGQISQVIQNIIINASHVMPDGGAIKIHGQNISLKDSNTLALEPGDYVKISIQDDGPGIPTKNLNKIFDPYFTTKSDGSGLGLAISHSIITKHGGIILANSPSGQGAIFTFYLKASRQKTLQSNLGPGTPPLPTSAKGKLLVMDDDEMIRNVSHGLLSSLGYDVLLAADGEEAIQLYRESMSQEKIDAIIMDLTIPGGMCGKDAVTEILKLDPEAKVIVSSGYSIDPVMANYTEYGFSAAIVKPYQRQDLSQVITQVLA